MNAQEMQNLTPLMIAEGRHLPDSHGRYATNQWYKNAQHEVTINHDKVTDHIIVGSVPITKADMVRIKGLGVSAIVDLCGDTHNEAKLAKDQNIDFIHEFVHDGYTPTQDQFKRLTAWIDAHVAAGRKVYIHCHAGAGRAPTVASAYLIYSRGIGVSHALTILREKRRHHIVSDRQKLGLRVFEDGLKTQKKGN